MKVIHVVTTTDVGGAQIMLQRYLSALKDDAQSHSVISLVPPGSVASQIEDLGVEVTDLGLRPGRITLGALWRLRRMLRDARPDVVHGWMYHGCLAAWAGLKLLPKRQRATQVWAVHHSLQDIKNEKRSTQMVVRMMAALSRKIELITYCSGVSQQQHEAIGFCPDRVELIANAVDTEVFKPDPDARARLSEIAGIPEAPDHRERRAQSSDERSRCHGEGHGAAGEMGHDVHAVLVGEGHHGSLADQAAQDLGISDRVSIIETRPDIHRIVPGFDIFLLSSAWGEAFPLAVSEAMAAEVPCVVTDVGDCAMLVGDTGRVVPPAQPEKQALAVAELIDEGPVARATLGKLARERVTKNFSTAIYVDRHYAAYDRARSVKF